MRKNRRSCPATWLVMTVVTLGCWLQAQSQERAGQRETQAVSMTGLLPIYGVDFNFEMAWVDGARFPSQSEKHSYFGVNKTFQQVWNALKPSGFNIIRFPVDVRDAQTAAHRVANLCVWSSNNNVKLVPVLMGAEHAQPLGVSFSSDVVAFNKALLAALRSSEDRYLTAYTQIFSYQLEHQMNHAGQHGAMPGSSAQLRLLQAASALRKAEQEGLKDTALNPRPLMVNASFDYELIRARALAGAPLNDEKYTRAYETLRQFLTEIAASPDVSTIVVDWFAGSLSGGSIDRFPTLVRQLTEELPDKQVVFTTGLSNSFHTVDELKQFYALTFANLADVRASAGADSPFIGVFFHEALNSKETNPAPPKPNAESEMVRWDRAARADELMSMWNGQASSAVMSWWLKKVENNMGLLALKYDSADNASISIQPPQESLQQIAATVRDASAAASNAPGTETNSGIAPTGASTTGDASQTPAGSANAGEPSTSTESGATSGFKEKARQALALFLDVVIDRLGQRLNLGNPGNYGGGNVGPGEAVGDNTNITTAPAPQTQVALGSPQIRTLNIGSGGPALTIGQACSVSFSVANPHASSFTGVKATLFVDGKEAQSRSVGALFPQQSRSVVFNNILFTQVGQHEIKIMLESVGAKPLTSSVAREIQVKPRVPPPLPPKSPNTGSKDTGSKTGPTYPPLPPKPPNTGSKGGGNKIGPTPPLPPKSPDTGGKGGGSKTEPARPPLPPKSPRTGGNRIGPTKPQVPPKPTPTGVKGGAGTTQPPRPTKPNPAAGRSGNDNANRNEPTRTVPERKPNRP